MADKTNANIGFEKQLWDAACVLWGHIPAAEYRKVIIGLIFLRYISAAFDKRYQELVEEGDGFEDDIDAYTMENVFFVPEEARWNTIAAAAHTPEIGTVIDNAMRAIEADNKALKGVLPKNYASPDLDKRVLGEVVDIFTNNIDISNAEVSVDLLGRTYEYCIAQFAAYEGVKGGEFSLFDSKFLEEIGKMKEKNLAVELLKKLISEQVIIYKRTNVVKSAKFSEIIQRAMNRYLNGMLTNEQVIEELLNLAKQIQTAQQEGQKLGLTADELAFYDALTKPQAIKDFYENEELIAITKELADALRKNKTIDWQKRDSARAKMRMLIKKLLKKHKYPPEGMDDAVQTVMLQCELWTDNNDMMEERVSNYASRLSEYVSEINK